MQFMSFSWQETSGLKTLYQKGFRHEEVSNQDDIISLLSGHQPAVSGTEDASSSLAWAESMHPKLSRSHRTPTPPTAILPSKAK